MAVRCRWTSGFPRRILLLAALAVLAASCAAPEEPPPRHAADGLRLAVSLDGDLDVVDEVFWLSSSDSLDAQAVSLTFEHYLYPAMAISFSLGRQDFTAASDGRDVGGGTELGFGVRWVPRPEWPVQPFVQAEALLFPRMRIDSGDNILFGASLGAGLAWYPRSDLGVEVYARTLKAVDPFGGLVDLSTRIDGTEVYAAVSYWF